MPPLPIPTIYFELPLLYDQLASYGSSLLAAGFLDCLLSDSVSRNNSSREEKKEEKEKKTQEEGGREKGKTASTATKEEEEGIFFFISSPPPYLPTSCSSSSSSSPSPLFRGFFLLSHSKPGGIVVRRRSRLLRLRPVFLELTDDMKQLPVWFASTGRTDQGPVDKFLIWLTRHWG